MGTETPQDIYKKLKFFYAYTRVMMGAKNLMNFDMMVSMPHGTFQQRMRDIEILTLRIYEYLADPTIHEKIRQCEDDFEKNPDYWTDWDRANLEQMKKIHLFYAALPIELFSKTVKMQSSGRHIKARLLKENDPAKITQYLSSVVETMREVAKRKADYFELDDLYQALFREHVDDFSTADLDRFHTDLANSISKITPLERPAGSATDKVMEPTQRISKRDMMQFGAVLLKKLGFSFDIGRLIVTEYQPYCAGTSMDARILVRCSDPPNFFTTLNDILYHGARGIYMQHIPENWSDQPVASLKCLPSVDACSCLFDTVIGGSRAFYDFLEHELEFLPSIPGDGSYSASNLFALKQKLNKFHAMESSLPLNMIKRNILITNIEKDLIRGDLEPANLQERWQQDMTSEFGDSDNIPSLTSVTEWFTGNLGAKASQNISYLMSLQIYQGLRGDISNLDDLIANGQFAQIMSWLDETLFSKANKVSFKELVNDISNSDNLNTDIINAFYTQQAGASG